MHSEAKEEKDKLKEGRLYMCVYVCMYVYVCVCVCVCVWTYLYKSLWMLNCGREREREIDRNRDRERVWDKKRKRNTCLHMHVGYRCLYSNVCVSLWRSSCLCITSLYIKLQCLSVRLDQGPTKHFVTKEVKSKVAIFHNVFSCFPWVVLIFCDNKKKKKKKKTETDHSKTYDWKWIFVFYYSVSFLRFLEAFSWYFSKISNCFVDIVFNSIIIIILDNAVKFILVIHRRLLWHCVLNHSSKKHYDFFFLHKSYKYMYLRKWTIYFT